MKSTTYYFFIPGLIFLLSCGDTSADKEVAKANNEFATEPTPTGSQQSGIIGEWEQQYTCYDTNEDAKLDQSERTPAKQMLGFNYFKFNADGSCLRDKDVKFEGKYEIKETKSGKDLVINSPEGVFTGVKYSINGEITNELVLYNSGVFLVFKRK